MDCVLFSEFFFVKFTFPKPKEVLGAMWLVAGLVWYYLSGVVAAGAPT